MTQKIRVADEKLGLLLRREWELKRRILEGTLDIDSVLFDLQKLIEGKSFGSNILQICSSVSFSDRIAAGKYDWVDFDIRENNFLDKIEEDYQVEYKIFHFNISISSDSVIAEMEKEGFRPANILEILKLGETQPNLQKSFPIVALGSTWQGTNSDCKSGLVLDHSGYRRTLGLTWFEGDWGSHYRFLGVRNIS